MIILALLKSNGRTPLQWWTFREAKPISVGRSLSNQVIVRNSHVSRHHCELRPVYQPDQSIAWELISQGKNGTFLEGKLISQVLLSDNATIQLAPKGPVLKVYLRDRIPNREELIFSSLGSDPKPTNGDSEDNPEAGLELVVPAIAPAIALDRITDITPLDLSSVSDVAKGQSKNKPQSLSQSPSQGPSQGPPAAVCPVPAPTEFRLSGSIRPFVPLRSVVEDRIRPLNPSEPAPAPWNDPSDLSTAGSGCTHPGNPPGNLLCIHCGHPLRVMRNVRHYQLLRILGQGGMGTTFLAWRLPRQPSQPSPPIPETPPQSPGQRLVVVKQLNPEIAAIAKARELFEREAAVLQRMNHPGIPKFLDAFSEGDQAYLVMELVHGQNLEQYVLKQGAAEPAQAIQWMQQTCDVLHHLHTQHPPILHRDIKPANLLRQYRDGRIVVVDFGAVKAMAGAMGTCIKAEGYTAPEQESGKPMIESDLFSVGATLVFLVTRRSPLDFYTALADNAPNLNEIAQMPVSLRRVLTKVLALNASDRYSSALELKLALTACLDDC